MLLSEGGKYGHSHSTNYPCNNMSENKVEILLKCFNLISEGPHWSEREQCLYFIDILRGQVCHYDPATNKGSICNMGEVPVGAVIPVKDTPGQFIVPRGRDLVHMHWTPGQPGPSQPLKVLGTIDQHKPTNRFNDGKCDPRGRFFVGTMGHEPVETPGVVELKQGSVYRFDDTDESPKRLFDKVNISNGLCWSLDKKIFYYIDTLEYAIEAFNYDEETGDLDLASRRTVFDFKKNGIEGNPDGMTIDTRGHIWVALFSGSEVIEIDPVAGKTLERIHFPHARNVTSVAFGGKDYKDLYVTSAATGPPEEVQAEAGSLFRISNLKSGGQEVQGFAHWEFPAAFLKESQK